jgi:predicted membrane-bound spermidine synthase
LSVIQKSDFEETRLAYPRIAAIACVAMAGVAYQVALVRLLSVVLWYHFAFLVVSLAVLGFGLSGVLLVLRPALTRNDGFEVRASNVAHLLVASVLCGYLTLATVPFDPFRIGTEPIQLVWGAIFVIAMMVPFLLNGLFVGMLLVNGAAQAGRLYAADLMGAGLAALATLVLFSYLGGEGALLGAGVFAALGGFFIDRKSRNLAVLAFAVVAMFVLPHVLGVRITRDKLYEGEEIAQLLQDPARNLETRWNSLSRVDVVSTHPMERAVLIDAGVAVTRLPRISRPISSYQPIRDFTCLGFSLIDAPSVVVLGSGGGWEVACALTHGASNVTAIELNPAITHLVVESQAEWTGHVFADPRVELVTAEARAYLGQQKQTWDVIVSAHTISNSASASGAMNLAESYTLTVEAFNLYLESLSERGVVFMTRPESQIPRVIANAAEALRNKGLSPEERMVAVRLRSSAPAGTEFTAGVLIARDPKVLLNIRAKVEAHGGEILWGDGVADPLLAKAFQVGTFPLATDDRPFFQFRGSWFDLTRDDFSRVFSAGSEGRLALEDAPVGEVSLLVLLVVVVLFSGVAIAIPLWLRREIWSGDVRSLSHVAVYFAALGFGYMYAELGLVHRLGVFLGSPTVTFGVVVAGLLICSGVGSAVSQRLPTEWARRVVLGAGVTLLVLGQASHAVVPIALASGTWGAVWGSLIFVVPIGFVLGMPFPIGMRMLHGHRGSLLPVAWGVNGFASVLASATSILIATEFGFAALLAAGALAYFVAAVAVSTSKS